MGEPLVSPFTMENHHHHHLSTLLSMDPFGPTPHPASPPHHDCRRDREIQWLHTILSSPPDINLPLSDDLHSPPPPQPQVINLIDSCDILDVNIEPVAHEAEVHHRAGNRKCVKRGDSVWGAWFFFNFYFKPALNENSKGRIARDANGVSAVEKSDLRLDVFMVQHDMENMYMWVFKERPENTLGKMQLRSYMNGHSRPGEPQFPFSADKGFVRSHRMQRKHYRGLSNPQCVLGIEVVRSPNLTEVSDIDRKKWMELTGRDVNFSVPTDASDFESWRNLSCVEFELERPPLSKGTPPQNKRQKTNGSGLNLITQAPSHGSSADGTETSSGCSNRRKDCCSNGNEKDCSLLSNSASELSQGIELHPVEPRLLNDFNGAIRHAHGPVTAAKTIYEDDQGYLIMICLPFVDLQKVKVSWKNKLTHGIVKIQGVSTAGMPYLKRHMRTFKLTDASPEHCPQGEFMREIPLPTRIPEDANLEAYCDETGTMLEILVPKHSTCPEEHEVPVCLRPPLVVNELLLT